MLKIKSSIFFIFGNQLEYINNKASSEEVLKQKKSEKTRACYKKLFDEVEEDSEDTYMTRILSKVWPDDNASLDNIAYAIAVSQTMLSPKYDKITISDNVVKRLIAKNLVIFIYIYIIKN